MPCSINKALIEKTINFHGHWCPGLAIGIRVSELAFQRLEDPEKADWVAVVETDLCGVDAVQVLTHCTFGKGNLIHRDYGKMAFSFFDRRGGKGLQSLACESCGEMIMESRTRRFDGKIFCIPCFAEVDQKV
jgi:formylmethanofuran dehydrogenase subunit E